MQEVDWFSARKPGEEARQKNWLPDLGLRWISWEKALPQWALSLENVGILGNGEMVFLYRRLRGVIYALVLWTSNATGQAGPPFRSDDPGTPGNGQWEINIAGVGRRNPAEGRYSLPNLDLNYGLGDRIQLKYEMAYGIEEVRGSTPSLAGGVGNSLAGVKYRFFETPANKTGESNFSMSVYPQLLFSAVSSSVRRGVADPSQFYLPFEYAGRVGQFTFSAEVGHWFARQQIPGTWTQALVLGDELSKRSEVFVELYRTSDFQNGQNHPFEILR
ncbi:MAG TPA: hypothetical protein VK638_16900 [Edaphobacter sp.]|nr:hypothetical protein [Edaphobacter sp.]